MRATSAPLTCGSLYSIMIMMVLAHKHIERAKARTIGKTDMRQSTGALATAWGDVEHCTPPLVVHWHDVRHLVAFLRPDRRRGAWSKKLPGCRELLLGCCDKLDEPLDVFRQRVRFNGIGRTGLDSRDGAGGGDPAAGEFLLDNVLVRLFQNRQVLELKAPEIVCHHRLAQSSGSAIAHVRRYVQWH
ncbi:hypothetical protein KC322_g80 [Hortaea werneckii]|nr:hypothetical protein KC322_g80 [Hortaea werneckii]